MVTPDQRMLSQDISIRIAGFIVRIAVVENQSAGWTCVSDCVCLVNGISIIASYALVDNLAVSVVCPGIIIVFMCRFGLTLAGYERKDSQKCYQQNQKFSHMLTLVQSFSRHGGINLILFGEGNCARGKTLN